MKYSKCRLEVGEVDMQPKQVNSGQRPFLVASVLGAFQDIAAQSMPKLYWENHSPICPLLLSNMEMMPPVLCLGLLVALVIGGSEHYTSCSTFNTRTVRAQF